MTDFDPSKFWRDSDTARRLYVDRPFSDADVRSIEAELGYKLPKSYLALMRTQNGGFPSKNKHRTSEQTTWARHYVAIKGIFSIGRESAHSLCGWHGSKFWVEEWEYPPIGIYFADCPSGGHDMLCLDYRQCGPSGEPRVVHVVHDLDYQITHVAENFASFINGLEMTRPSKPANVKQSTTLTALIYST